MYSAITRHVYRYLDFDPNPAPLDRLNADIKKGLFDPNSIISLETQNLRTVDEILIVYFKERRNEAR